MMPTRMGLRSTASRSRAATLPSLLMFFIPFFSIVSLGASDSKALLKFREALENGSSMSNWDASVIPCNANNSNWIGVICVGGNIWGLQLEHMELTGHIDIDSLSSLPNLRTISLMNNKFGGPLPEIKKLGKLKALFLSNNRFSGNVAENSFDGMRSLKRVFLANNAFTGNIPSSLTALPKLMELRLEGNQFTGLVPSFQQIGLKTVNLARNELEGPIPLSLSHLVPSSFSGNKGLCGPPLDPCNSSVPDASVSTNERGKVWKIIITTVIVVVVLAGIAAGGLVLLTKRRQMRKVSLADSSIGTEKGKQAILEGGGQQLKRADHSKLVFLKEDIEQFDLQDLLKASAEVLGSGRFGSSYKAIVANGQALVVKRYRHMNEIGREEFDEHMRRLGSLQHPNLLPVIAYYYRKSEALLVTEFVKNRSLACHLHGKHGLEDQLLDWSLRLKITKGVANGLAGLYQELPIIVPHGHLKSSNVLLGESFEPLLADYGLRPVINTEHAHMLMMAYKSPEYAQHGRISRKTDIWSLGILILEVLTGKFPENYLMDGFSRDEDLATWVNNMVKEKQTSQVFDKDMRGTKNSKGEMIKLLKIGLRCCSEDPERKLDLVQVVEEIQELKEKDGEETDDVAEYDGSGFRLQGHERDSDSELDR